MPGVIDELAVRIGTEVDARGLEGLSRRWGQFKQRVQAGVRVIATAGAAAGAAAFATGAPVERQFLKMQTQLGVTASEIEALRPMLRGIAKDLRRPFEEVTAAYFSARSAGLQHAAALDTVTNAAKAANIEAGNTAQVAKLAAAAQKAYNDEAVTGTRVIDVLIGTLRAGNISEASELVRAVPALFQVAPQLGVSLENLFAIIAGGTRTGASASAIGTQLQQILFGLLRPTATARKEFKAMGIELDDLRKRARDGLIPALQWLREQTGDNTDTLAKLFESQEAVALLFDITGDNADAYRRILRDLETQTQGLADEGQRLFGQSGFGAWQGVVNDFKIRLADIYDTVLKPVLLWFQDLPEAIQMAVGAGGLALVGSAILGIGAGLFGTLITAGLLLAAIAGLVIAGFWLWANWDKVTGWIQDKWEELWESIRSGEAWEEISRHLDNFWGVLEDGWEQAKPHLVRAFDWLTEKITELYAHLHAGLLDWLDQLRDIPVLGGRIGAYVDSQRGVLAAVTPAQRRQVINESQTVFPNPVGPAVNATLGRFMGGLTPGRPLHEPQTFTGFYDSQFDRARAQTVNRTNNVEHNVTITVNAPSGDAPEIVRAVEPVVKRVMRDEYEVFVQGADSDILR